MRKSATGLGEITCITCGISAAKTSTGPQKYCRDCSQIKDLERKRKWAKNNPLPNEVTVLKSRKVKSLANEKGKLISHEKRNNILWPTSVDDSLTKLVRVSIPFDYGISKNSTWSTTRTGHVFLRKEHSRIRDLLSFTVKTAVVGQEWFEDKVWIDIFVQKPDQKGDAVNVIDAVCDAVKEAIGVDDRWFAIRKLDWEIVKENPMLFVGVGQSATSHKRVCSSCGRVLELDNFHKNRANKLGVSRNCKECMSLKPKK